MLLLCILFSTIIFVGCSTVIIGPSGSIEITTNPSGAKIFLDGKDTGKITPYTLKNISVGSHIIEVTLSDMKCTKIAKVTTYQTTNINIEFYSQITLNKINVLPSTTNITLSLGSTVTVSSVTAYYSDYSSANIPLVNCNYSSNDACATINSSGTITGISAGAAIITVSYTEGEITKTDTVSVLVRNTPTDTPITPPVQDDIVYRALLVGVGDYENNDGVTLTDLDGPPYDVDRIIQVLNQCKFGSDEIGFSLIEPLKDLSATKEAIINGIASTFSGADDNDISYFYFSGHGSYTGVFENSYILPTDVDGSIDSAISVDELEIALSAILGTKVVIFDSCFSGGFIGKGKGEIIISREKLTSFNDEIINIFSQVQSKGLLTTNKYKVLTSCHYNQPCVEYSTHPVDGNPYGLFTAAFCKGCGYDDGTYYADSDNNTKVSLQEAYSYIKSTLILSEQDVQVYPTNSTFTIAEY
jgi:hypothetical protein